MLDNIIEFANLILDPIINMGAAPLMLIVLTLVAMLVGVKFSSALEGGIKLAIAITGIGAVMGILTGALSEPLNAFIENTGIQLNVIDTGWAPLGTITWGHPLTLFFLLVLIILNVILIILNKTDTFDADIFNVWHLSIVGLFAMYSGANLLTATLLVIVIGVLKFKNADLMNPTFSDLLDAPPESPMTTTHMGYMMNPIIMVFDKIFDKFFGWLDKYDFDATELNEKIGFWGSRFMIGVYLGIFIGILGGLPVTGILELSFTVGAMLELFAIVGQWFIEAVEPLSQGIVDFANKRLEGRKLNISIDWPFIAGRSEIWVVANLLAPIALVISLFLPGNRIMPSASIVAVGLTPALLIVTRGKIIRMLIIGIIEIPLFLWAATLIAPFVTNTAEMIGALPETLLAGQEISFALMEGPIEKFLAYTLGGVHGGGLTQIIIFIVFLAVYMGLFYWYQKEMEKRNAEYIEELEDGTKFKN